MISNVQISMDDVIMKEWNEESIFPPGIYLNLEINHKMGEMGFQFVNENGVPYITGKKTIQVDYDYNAPEKEGILKRIKGFFWRGKN